MPTEPPANGGYAVFDKATGVRTELISDGAFWTAAGQTEGTYPNGLPLANGDSRGFTEVLFAYASCMANNGQTMAGLNDT